MTSKVSPPHKERTTSSIPLCVPARPQEKVHIAMMRDELLQLITAVPSDTDIGVQLGNDHLDIVDLVPWGDGQFNALKCHPKDLRDLLIDWGLPDKQREQIAPKCGAANANLVDKTP